MPPHDAHRASEGLDARVGLTAEDREALQTTEDSSPYELVARSGRIRFTALLSCTNEGLPFFQKDEDDRLIVEILPCCELSPQELTSAVLAIKRSPLFRSITHLSRDCITIQVTGNTNEFLKQLPRALQETADAVSSLRSKNTGPTIWSTVDTPAGRSGSTEDDRMVRNVLSGNPFLRRHNIVL